ncbi:MAG: M60 family metallopeptidase [Bacteroides sp.]|nr:M60 family metallopeptidase [Bacillota bacterium]MCM1394018.1 M60 family metallopeptidase [[Eubacterium] siraeum]MCM1455773.1 M60 family metallopeptidase [Bacteroides sp.]
MADKSSTKNTAQTKTTGKSNTTAKSSAASKKAEQTKSATPARSTATTKSAPAAKSTPTTKSATPAKSAPTAKKTANEVKPETKKAPAVAEEKTSKKAVKPEQKAPVEKKAETSKKKDAKTVAARGEAKRAASETKPSAKASGDGTATMSKKNIRTIIIAASSVLLALIITLSLVLGLRSCNQNPGLGPDSNIVIDKPDNGNYVEGILKPNDAYKDITVGAEHYFDSSNSNPDDLAIYAAYNKREYDVNKYKTSSTAGYLSEVIGTVNRVIPAEPRDEGLGAYPKYGYSLSTVIGTTSDKVAARRALINESSYLTATGTRNAGGGGYTWMDENGYLYSGTRHEDKSENTPALDANGKHRRLYKHTTSQGLYLGNGTHTSALSDAEQGIIKKVTMRPRTYTRGYSVTGIYAPAGEVIKISISSADMDATGGIVIHIGQALYNNKSNNIWTEKNQMQRFPNILNTMSVNKDTAEYNEETGMWEAYVGSFLGGPLYICDESVTFTATISGGVAYRHFILGYTTEAEYAELCKSTAPYFDLEVWDRGVLLSGPLYYARNFTYEQIYNVAVLWDKVATVATTNGANQGIVFLFDPFVAAGAAVAFPGQGSVNCPMSWMGSALNYNAIVTSGDWGDFHEYHHNFQNFGIGYTGEVTNNALTLVSYSLFTKISAARQIGSYGGAGLSGWNQYTSASWALQRVNNNQISSTDGLAVYATLLHNFGQDVFIKARGSSGVGYLNRFADLTHYDFSYFDQSVTGYTGGALNPAATKYPTFVPVSSVYQTGRTYTYRNYNADGDVTSSTTYEINTMQPYVIPTGRDFLVDLRPYSAPNGQYASGSVVIGNGFAYNIKGFRADGINGSFAETETDGVYRYTPDGVKTSGKIYVTLELTTSDGNAMHRDIKLDDVDLVLEFQPSHESTKLTLERTTYTYEPDAMYIDAVEAYEANFAGYSEVSAIDHTNPTQNCNTDIWYWPADYKNQDQYAGYVDTHPEYFISNNKVAVIDGKLYANETGKYRIYLRGRVNCALYYSLDGGETYQLGATVKNGSGANFYLTNPDTYFDVELTKGDWVYIKEVLIVTEAGNRSYIGVGMSQWTEPMYRTETKYYNAAGQEVSEDSEDAVRSETKYYDQNNREVTADEANSTDLIAPTSAAYVNAYRRNYEFSTGGFESDYFYVRNYNYNFVSPITVETSTWKDGARIVETNFAPETTPYGIDNLFTEGTTTYIHSGKNVRNVYFTIDMGEEITANSIIFLGRTDKNTANTMQGYPKNFNLEVSTDGENYTSAGSYNNPTGSGTYEVTVKLDKAYTFRYIKITIVDNHSNTGRIILSGIKFAYTMRLNGNGANNISLDNEMFTYVGEWKGEQALSVYGHVYVGQSGAGMTFTFNGTHIGFITPTAYENNNFTVLIDGQLYDSIDVGDVTGAFGITYLSPKLENGKHTVTVICSGESAFDSIVYYEQTE